MQPEVERKETEGEEWKVERKARDKSTALPCLDLSVV